MKNYIDFVSSKDLSKNKFAQSLECGIDELQILQYMAKSLLENQISILTSTLIINVFNKEALEATKYLESIKTLINLEYLYVTNDIVNSEILLLELLNSHVALTPSFLKLLEKSKTSFTIPKITPYKSDMDYLKDEFNKINLLQKSAILRKFEGNSKVLSQTKRNLVQIKRCIKQRLKITKNNLHIIDFLNSYALNSDEITIFLALLKEECYLENDKIREIGSLLELVSIDEYSKISNKYILDEQSNLMQSGLIDYDEDMLSPFSNVISKNFYIPNHIIKKILRPKDKKTNNYIDDLIKNQDLFELIHKQVSLDDVVLPSNTKERLDLLIKQLDSKVVDVLQKWGIKDKSKGIDAKIMFYGYPGTGKTLTAYALANALKKPILSLDCSKILSMYVGESEKNVRKIFDTYSEITSSVDRDAILLLNEADQFLSQRNTLGSSVDKMYNQMQNLFLDQIERFDGILIATTNLLENIDIAFSRRFNYKIEFIKPDSEQRLCIWKKLLPKGAKYVKNFDLPLIASYPLSGGQIKIVVKNTAYKVVTRSNMIFTTQDFIDEINKELDSSFERERQMGFVK